MDKNRTEKIIDEDVTEETIPTWATITIICALITAVGGIIAGLVTGTFEVWAAKITASPQLPPEAQGGSNSATDKANGGTTLPIPSSYQLRIGHLTAVDLDRNKTGNAQKARPAGADLEDHFGRLQAGSESVHRDSSVARCKALLESGEGGVGSLEVGDLERGDVVCMFTDEGRSAFLTVKVPTRSPRASPLILDVQLKQ